MKSPTRTELKCVEPRNDYYNKRCSSRLSTRATNSPGLFCLEIRLLLCVKHTTDVYRLWSSAQNGTSENAEIAHVSVLWAGIWFNLSLQDLSPSLLSTLFCGTSFNFQVIYLFLLCCFHMCCSNSNNKHNQMSPSHQHTSASHPSK